MIDADLNPQIEVAKLCRSVLIIEDNDSLRDAMLQAVLKRGLPSAGARNGTEAIELLPKLPRPSLIFLDLMMPRMNGWDLLTHWNELEHFEHDKVILMSAVSAKHRPDQRPLPKTDGVLQKPLSLSGVLGFVNRFCLIADKTISKC